MTAIEALAVTALRRWCYNRAKQRSGTVTNYKRQGWQERNNRQCDARLIYCIDFERIFAKLPAGAQVMLLLAHRDGWTEAEIACSSGISVRSTFTYLEAARTTLGELLEANNLL